MATITNQVEEKEYMDPQLSDAKNKRIVCFRSHILDHGQMTECFNDIIKNIEEKVAAERLSNLTALKNELTSLKIHSAVATGNRAKNCHALAEKVKQLELQPAFKYNGSFYVSVVHSHDGTSFAHRQGWTYIYCTDERIVYACNGLNIDGTTRRECYITEVEKPAPVVMPSGNKSWADYDDEDEELYSSTDLSTSSGTNSLKVSSDSVDKSPKSSSSLLGDTSDSIDTSKAIDNGKMKIINYKFIPTLVPAEMVRPLSQAQIDYNIGKWNDHKKEIFIALAVPQEIKIDWADHSRHILCTTHLPESFTEKQVLAFFSQFADNKSLPVIINGVSSVETFPQVRTVFAGKNHVRMILVKFATDQDCLYGYYMGRQFRQGTEVATFVNALLSVLKVFKIDYNKNRREERQPLEQKALDTRTVANKPVEKRVVANKQAVTINNAWATRGYKK